MEAALRTAFSAEELTRLFDQVPAVVWACDRDLRFTFGAGSALDRLGLSPHQLIGVPAAEYFGSSPDAARIMEHVRGALAGESAVYDVEWNGVVFESHVSPLRDAAGEIAGVIGIALDITERRVIEEELILSRFRLQHTSALFPVAHYVTDASGTIRLLPEHRQLLGLPESTDRISYEDVLALVHPDDRKYVLEARRIGIANRRPYYVEFRLVRPDGSIRHLRAQVSPVFDERGQPVRSIGTLTDMTAEVEQQQQITELLRHDGLTGLPNRTYFSERMRHDLAFASGDSELMALVLIDLDRFSRINDSLGHLAGDEYLRIIASRLRSLQEGSANVASRIGADEFAVLLRGAQRRGDLVRRIENLRTLLEEPVVIGDRPLHVSVSMGVALYPYDASDHTLLQKADLALSHARDAGMARTEFYDLMLAEDAASSVSLEHGLHSALKDGQLVPYYQAIVDKKRGLCAVEALVRWNHPAHGLLTPSTFLDVAEESGLIIELGNLVLRQACRDVAELRKHAPWLRLNVNLSSRHLLSSRLIDSFAETLAETGLPPHAVQIEVTEQSLIEDVAVARKAIAALRSLGASVVIDDFGTGYNTLAYVKSYHVDGIKLDRTFVKDLITDRYSRAICEGVMAMARSLELPVIAEGIETAQQRDAAIAMGCDELQGFLFGRPLAAHAFAASLSDFIHKTA